MRFPTAPLSIGLSVGLAISLLVASIVTVPAGPALSREPDRTLKFFFGHTGEKDEFTYKRNGSYNRAEINRLNKFLRDWRRNEPAKMDPQLLDLVWAVYKESGSRDYIHVISAYRSPATNKMLRTRSSGVAKNSQHMLGKAMDFYLPDVPLAKLRGIAMKMQGGGVGYYPRSGSPFVHVDTGNVRAWPRMSRQQLIALFPRGNTLHLPADGKPLPGYETAVARRKSGGTTALAYLDTADTNEAEETDRTGTDTSSTGWLKRVFPRERRNNDVAAAPPAPAPTTEEPQIIAAALTDEEMPRPPRARPASAMETPAAEAPIVIASVDAKAVGLLAEPPLPRTRPGFSDDSQAVVVNGQDAIASLTERMSQESPTSTADPAAQSIALAFAAAAESPQPSEADRAILTAFAALGEPGAVRNADPALTAAATRLASAEKPQLQPKPLAKLALTYAGSALLPAAQAAPAPVAEPGAGIVLAPVEEIAYGGDEPALVELIETPETSNSNDSQLAMPTPASELYLVPEGASEVADLRGKSGPPTERFAPRSDAPAEEGFFTRLFASLVE